MANADNLIERDAALERIERLVGDLCRGRGAVVAVRGAVGLGTSALLDHAGAAADAGGAAVRRFRSTPAERTLAGAGTTELLGPGGEARAGEHPVLLVVDDVQWLDQPTLRWLHHLGRRLDERPVGILVSCRPGLTAPDLVELLALADTVDLQPLTERGVDRLVRSRLGTPGPGFVERCCGLTGGNPFVLGALLDTLTARGLPAEAASLDDLEPPARVSDAVRLRLMRCGEATAAVAGAAAVAGRHATLARLCELTGLAPDEVTVAVEELQAAGLVDSGAAPSFLHPLEASAAIGELSPSLVERLHRRMAELLHHEGADDVEIAPHLEQCGPIDEPWAPLTLRRAGQRSAHGGDHATAVRWLRRALTEQVTGSERAELLGVLAGSELAMGLPAGIGRLRALSETSTDPADRLRLARILALHGRMHEAASELDELLETTRGVLRERVLRQQLSTLRQSLDLRPRSRSLLEQLTADADGGAEHDPALLAELAYEHALAGTSRDVVADLGNRALEAAERGGLSTSAVHVLFLSLVWSGELRAAHRLVQLRDRSGELESVQHHRRGQLALAVGAVEQAHAHGLAALERVRIDAPVIYPAAVAQLARTMIRLGDLDDADRRLEPVLRDLALRELATFHSVLLARAELALACGDWDDALAAADACRRFSERMGTENPVVMPWHPVAAEALVALERLDEAHELATDALARIEAFGYSSDDIRRPLERIRQTVGTEERRSVRAHPSRATTAPTGPVLLVLGTSRLQRGDDEVVLGTDLADRALRFLATRRTSVHRDQLVEALWPDVEPTVGRARLRKVLFQLRHRHGDVLESSGDLVGLAGDVVVDVREFRRHALAALDGDDDTETMRAGQAALDWYGGELCELDRYEDWAAELREAVRQEWSAVSQRVAERFAEAGDHDRALVIVERLIADEPWNEAHFLMGIRWLAATGRRPAARALIGRARAAARELGIPASPELDDLEAELTG